MNRWIIPCAVEALLILLMSLYGDFLKAGEAWRFTLLGIAAGGAYWAAARCYTRAESGSRETRWVFWMAAVALRLAILPVLAGDDIWRYRWEGMLQLHGLSPYRFSPDSPALAFLRDADWLKINHREYPAIYPPLTEAVFAALAAMGNAVWLYKLLFMAVDLATIGVLRRLLARCGASRKQAAWYAWNPLAIYSFAGAAHFDGLMILPLVAAVCALQEYESAAAVSRLGKASQDDRHTHLWTSSIFLGLSIATKIAPVALLPVWAFAARSGRRGVGVLAAAIAPLAILAFIYGFPGTPVFTALLRFGDSIRVNDLLWWLVEATLLPDIAHYRGLYAGCTLAACVALAYWFRRDWKRSFLWVWGAALLLSPVVHAWYITWMLPLAAWRGEPARAWFVFSISVFGYFLLWEVNHASGKPWEEPVWLRLAIFLPPLAAFAWTAATRPRGARPAASPCQKH